MSKHVTRQELAELVEGISARQIERNERKWGLDKARVKCAVKPVLFVLSKAKIALKVQGFLVE